ncbi:LytTR family DNA-binding domain-containing protein [Flavihumibacter petaseus]|uniref:Putative LytTR family DNA-binding protein n=1 Tax=Flavihumibacter petaseus NBRC 106054 TaxID=1220578 RepID=A0A0E9MVE3_9BACT|nr:LytTR family DNA-binding domain-containing protein [Flavihumibacter petaseus]GAO41381.1 putative LytTR family DNA-binding protein [Flavihumibacter petaseus NBRC 106054]
MQFPPIFISQPPYWLALTALDIAAISADGVYSRFHINDGSYHLVRSSLAASLRDVPQGLFIRINRTYAVNIYYIKKINKDHVEIGKDQIEFTKPYYAKAMKSLILIGGRQKIEPADQ